MIRRLAPLLLVLASGCNSLLDLGGEFVVGGPVDAMTIDADPEAPDAGPPAPIHALALGTDFTNATAGLIDVRAGTVTLDVLPGVLHGDLVLRRSNDELFIVNRFGSDQILVVAGTPLAVTRTYQLPTNSNPQDVSASDTQLYVPALDSSGMLRVDRQTGVVTPIPLLAGVDPDGKPDCVSAFFTGGRLYIACGLLDGSFQPRGVGKLVVFDPFNDTVVRTLDLPFANPFGLLQPTEPATPADGALVIGTVDFGNLGNGCLVTISLGEPEVATCLINNAALGGYAQRAEADVSGETLWINSATVNRFGRAVGYAGGNLGLPISDPGQEIVDLTVCPDGYLLVSDRKPPAGIRIYRDGVEVDGPMIDLGEPPVPTSGVACF